MLARLVFTLLLPGLTWLLLGVPSLALPGNLLVFAVLVFFEWSWLWHRAVFRIVRGDEFVFGHVSLVVATFALLGALGLGGGFLALNGFALASWRQIPPLVILGWLLCLTAMWLLPLLSGSRSPRPYRPPAD